MLVVIKFLLCVNVLNLFKCMLYKCHSTIALLLMGVNNLDNVRFWYQIFKGINS
jgi:hypothetical protein